MHVLTCSRHFPKGHPKTGEPTFFVEQILNVLLPRPNGVVNLNDIKPEIRPFVNDFYIIDGSMCKYTTIRAGSRFKPGDMVSLRVWSDKPYRSKQIEFAQVEVKKVYPIEIYIGDLIVEVKVDEISQSLEDKELIAKNDGLELSDFVNWFKIHPKAKKGIFFTGQIICWSNAIEYGKPELLTDKMKA